MYIEETWWNWRGEVNRGPFFVGVAVLTALKYNLDRALAWGIADEYWTPLSYFEPLTHTNALGSPEMTTAWWWMLGTAVPFLWFVLRLFVRRLRSVAAPPWLAVLALVPAVNVVMYLILSVLPRWVTVPESEWRAVPESALGASAAGLLAPVVPAFLGTLVAIYGFEEYGFALFVAIPFCSGFGAAIVYGTRQPRGRAESIAVACGSVLVLGLALLALAVEGVICLLMAAPIGVVLAAAGGAVGHAVMQRRRSPKQLTAMLIVLTLSSPVLMGFERLDETKPPLHQVTTTVEIDAPPEVVWDQVIVFSELPAPKHFWFESGIAYPTHARIEGHGPGAIRYCEFSTGPFVEPIEVWDEPHRLAFRVEDQPRSMKELSPWGEIDAPHIDDYLRSERGEFRLERLPSGGTRLEGTTWYRHHIWPASYWRLWSDAIIHSIHERVLDHIRHEAEMNLSGAVTHPSPGCSSCSRSTSSPR